MRERRGAAIDLPLGDGRTVRLTLVRVPLDTLFVGEVTCICPEEECAPEQTTYVPNVVWLRGRVEGSVDSSAVLVLSPSRITGYVTFDGSSIVITSPQAGRARLSAVFGRHPEADSDARNDREAAGRCGWSDEAHGATEAEPSKPDGKSRYADPQRRVSGPAQAVKQDRPFAS